MATKRIADHLITRTTRQTRRGILGLGVSGGAIPFLAACGANSAATKPAASATPVSIEHVDWWGPTTPVLTTYFEGIKKDFEGQNPSVTVNFTHVQGTGGAREKWVVNAAGGTPHDSSQVSVAFVRDLMDAGTIEPLDGYIAKTPDLALANFVDSGKFYNTFEGKHYGIPYDGSAINVIAYNVDHFKEAGLDPSTKLTWNWTVEQFLESARRLVKTEGGRRMRGAFPPVGLSVSNLLPWLYANGGDFYSQDYTKTLVNGQAGRQALQLLQDLRYRHQFASEVDGATFESEGYAMQFRGSWEAGYILDKNAKIQFGFAPIPQGPSGTRHSSQTWTNMWAMMKESKKKDTAWRWVSFVNSEPVQERYFATVMKRVSGRNEFYQSAAWKNVLKEYPALVDIEKLEPVSKQYPWVKTTPINNETADVWKKAQANEISVNEALAQVEQIVNRVLVTK